MKLNSTPTTSDRTELISSCLFIASNARSRKIVFCGVTRYGHISLPWSHYTDLVWQVEYVIVKIDEAAKRTKLSLRAFEVLAELQKPEQAYLNGQTS